MLNIFHSSCKKDQVKAMNSIRDRAQCGIADPTDQEKEIRGMPALIRALKKICLHRRRKNILRTDRWNFQNIYKN